MARIESGIGGTSSISRRTVLKGTAATAAVGAVALHAPAVIGQAKPFDGVTINGASFQHVFHTYLKEYIPEFEEQTGMTVNFEHKVFHIDAGAQLASVNHVPVPWAEFAHGAAAVDSVEQLLRAIRCGTPPTSGPANLVPATEVLMAAYRSIVEGGPVRLPLAEGGNPLQERESAP